MYDVDWINDAVKLENNGHSDAALDIIYDTLDDLIIAEEYNNVDYFLKQLIVNNYSASLLYGIAAITYYAAEHLPSRSNFAYRVRTLFNTNRNNLSISKVLE